MADSVFSQEIQARATFFSGIGLSVEVETDCPQGGDSGKTRLRLTDEVGTTWSIRIKGMDGRLVEIAAPQWVEIETFGDMEWKALSECLKFAAKVLGR